ncbi:hypothetical protein ACROYT_G031697 [Oculina patagonica]
MVRRVCRDCPVPGCGAKYLVKLSNHLTNVHQLDLNQRRKWLQEAKLQPKVKVIIYENTENSQELKACTIPPSIQQQGIDINYQLSTSRKSKDLLKNRSKGIRKTDKTSKRSKIATPSHLRWLSL